MSSGLSSFPGSARPVVETTPQTICWQLPHIFAIARVALAIDQRRAPAAHNVCRLAGRLAHHLEPWRPGGEGVALTLEVPGIADKRVDLCGEPDQLPPELGGILLRRGRSRSRLAR